MKDLIKKISRKLAPFLVLVLVLSGFLTRGLVVLAEENTETPASEAVVEEVLPETVETLEENVVDTNQENLVETTEVLNDQQVEDQPENTEENGEAGDINTGDATSSSDVVNQVNTTEVNSEGEIVTVNGSLGNSSLDLRDSFADMSTTSTPCDDCLSTTTIQNQNTATVTNNIVLVANTGENTASTSGDISTGDAYAASNVVNVVNTNIVESNYMMLVFNNFGDWAGDLVFPNINFFANFLSLFGGCDCGGTSVGNQNNALVSNIVDSNSNTGGNTGEGEINTGDAFSSSNTYNLVNQNIYGDSSFSVMIKVLGDWSGNIFNLPDEIGFENTPEGLVLFDKKQGLQNISGSSNSSTDIQNENYAEVENNVSLHANTGGNNAGGDINTGNAYTGSNTINVVNTNIVSSNWVAALVNILGNWSGNISFGQPDLWVGTFAQIEGPAEGGSAVKFKTLVKNMGDARASNINILFDSVSDFVFSKTNDGFDYYSIEALNPGESREIEFFGYVDRYAKGGQINISTLVSSFETDANNKNNKDSIFFKTAYNPGAIILPQTESYSSYPDIYVEKTHSIPSKVVIDGDEMLPFGGSVDYKIVVKNRGGISQNSVLFDELRDEQDNVISRQKWELGEIFPDEEIEVTYTIEFKEDLAPGVYTNYAWVEAQNIESNFGLEKDADSNVAKSSVKMQEKLVIENTEVIEEPMGEVLAAFDEKYKNVKVERENLLEETQEDLGGLNYTPLLGGFCFLPENPNTTKNKMLTLHGSLLGFSFVLIISGRRRRE